MGEATLKLVKFFVVLTQTNQYPQFSGQTGPLALYYKLLALPTLLLDGVLLTHTALMYFHQPFCLGEAGRHSPQWVGLFLISFAWVRGGWGSTINYSQFPKQALQFGGAVSYPQPCLQLNPPVCV